MIDAPEPVPPTESAEKSKPGSLSRRPKAYFQSMRARTASAACLSESPSQNCITVTKANLHGAIAGLLRAPRRVLRSPHRCRWCQARLSSACRGFLLGRRLWRQGHYLRGRNRQVVDASTWLCSPEGCFGLPSGEYAVSLMNKPTVSSL